jgi:cyclohexyl-isocyanide hydratase
LKVSVCTGSLLLGAAGFLRGLTATTHPSALKELEPYCDQVVRQRIVDQGAVVTAGGVSTSIDLGLHLVERLAGAEARARVARQMDYPYTAKMGTDPVSSL